MKVFWILVPFSIIFNIQNVLLTHISVKRNWTIRIFNFFFYIQNVFKTLNT